MHSNTVRGFSLIEFRDKYGAECSLQKSSAASEPCIWLGITDAKPQIMASKLDESLSGWLPYPIPDEVHINTRMHLTIDQVKELIPYLQKFVETGEIYE